MRLTDRQVRRNVGTFAPYCRDAFDVRSRDKHGASSDKKCVDGRNFIPPVFEVQVNLAYIRGVGRDEIIEECVESQNRGAHRVVNVTEAESRYLAQSGNGRVVNADEFAVGRATHVDFNALGSVLCGSNERVA
jgi:hypothetical protein